MTVKGLESLRKVLAVLPVVRANQGIRVTELARITGIPAGEIVTDLPDLVNLCGVPPYSPMDLVDLAVEGDRVTIRFAEQFRRPVRLTPGEALALDMALAGWGKLEHEPFARAVNGIREKVRAALEPESAEEVDRVGGRISALQPVGRAGRSVEILKDALSRQIEAEIEYFSRKSGSLGRRSIRPYGIFEQDGHWYVVALSVERGMVMTFRADRIRSCLLTEGEYEIPEEFDVSVYLRTGPPEHAENSTEVRVEFAPEAARFAIEGFPAESFVTDEGGGATASLETSGTAWLVSELLRWGARAVVVEPADLRNAVVSRAREALAVYGRDS